MILQAEESQISVFDTANKENYWQAQFSRVDQSIDQKSRWRNLFLTLDRADNPDKKLPTQGTFLQAEISINLNIAFLRVDEKSLSMQGEIWIVNDDNLLKKIKPTIAFRNNGFVYLNLPKDLDYPIELVSTPSSTLLEGMKVSQQQLDQEQINAE